MQAAWQYSIAIVRSSGARENYAKYRMTTSQIPPGYALPLQGPVTEEFGNKPNSKTSPTTLGSIQGESILW